MTPMSEERLADIEADLDDVECAIARKRMSELLVEVHRLRALPPDVVAAMERYANRAELLRTESYYEYEADLDTIATHFTTLFQKGNQP